MRCNIDAKGRAVRRAGGIVCCVLAVASAGLALSGVWRTPLLATAAGLTVAGLFQLFESGKGWCALRAMGIKTPV